MHRPHANAATTPPVQRWFHAHGRQSFLLAVLYFLFGQLSFLVQVDDVLVTPVLFAPEGIALAMALRFGAGVWPGIFGGQFALALSRGLAPLPAASISAVNSLEAVIAVLLFRLLKLDVSLPRARDLSGLLLVVFSVLQPFSATFGTATLRVAGVITQEEWTTAWIDWWIGNALAQMLVTPLLLALFAGGRTRLQVAGDFAVPVLAVGSALVAAEHLLRWTGLSSWVAVLAPILVVVAIYRGLAAVCVGGLFIAVSALYATSHAFGPFVTGGQADILNLNLFIVGLSLSGQFLAAFLRQLGAQNKVVEQLTAAREHLQRTAFELTENIPVGTYTMVQPPGGGMAYFSFLSKRFLELTGLDRASAKADPMNAFACVHPEDREEWIRKNAHVFAHKLPFKEETRIIVKGETRWIRAESAPRDLPDGSVLWEGVLTDITDRKLAEQKVAASEARLRTILDNIPVPVAINDAAKDGGIVFLNEAFTLTFGYTPSDIPDVAAWNRLACPDDGRGIAPFKTWDAAAAEAARGDGTVEPMEIGITAKDGTRRDVIINAVALENMLLIGFVDITARKKAEDELRETTRRMTLAASTAGIGFWSRDLAGTAEQWDEQMHRIYGIDPGQFTGDWEALVHPDDLPAVQLRTAEAIASGRTAEYEFRIRRPDGTVRHIHGLSTTVPGADGQPLREIGVDFDITEEKKAAEREKKLEERHRRELETKLRTSLSAAAVAHEINQPLSTILLQSKMALQDEGAALAALAVVAEEARRVVATIEKMKTLLRNVQTEHRPVDLAEVARSSLLYSKGLLARHDVAVHAAGFDRSCRIMGDGAQLQLVLTNLLRNAVEAISEAASDKREISVELADRSAGVELVVGDSGPGWPPDGPAEEPLTTTKKAGTGIGLYVVRTAMQNHGGEIIFGRSSLGGAEVRLKFPRLS